jgi:hypothetical protein
VGRLAPALCVLAVALAGCGTAGRTTSDRQWLANARVLVEQLRSDLVLSSASGADVASAQQALHNDSDLYTLLLAYSDLGGCDRMVANMGAVTRRLVQVQVTLTRACASLQRASTLFSVAARDDDPRALLTASQVARDASPLLVRAELQLGAKNVR